MVESPDRIFLHVYEQKLFCIAISHNLHSCQTYSRKNRDPEPPQNHSDDPECAWNMLGFPLKQKIFPTRLNLNLNHFSHTWFPKVTFIMKILLIWDLLRVATYLYHTKYFKGLKFIMDRINKSYIFVPQCDQIWSELYLLKVHPT